MAIQYKFKVLPALLEKGYSTYTLRKKALLSEGTIQKLRACDSSITVKNIDTLCALLGCQPGDILEYAPDADPVQRSAQDEPEGL